MKYSIQADRQVVEVSDGGGHAMFSEWFRSTWSSWAMRRWAFAVTRPEEALERFTLARDELRHRGFLGDDV